jgi:tRNA pseudouridine-54 N-methylase
VIVTYTAASGCKDTISMTVQTDCGTAVHDINGTAGKINIFPHPTNGDFYLSIPMTGSVEVSISDLYGRVLISKKVDVVRSNKIHFNESANLPAGSYILRVANNDQMLTERMTIIK